MTVQLVLAVLLVWAALDVAILVALNLWRREIEQRAGSPSPAPPAEFVGYIDPPTFYGWIKPEGGVDGFWDDEEEQA